VKITQGSLEVGSARVKHGVAKVALPYLSLGPHTWTVHHAGTSAATSATKTWIVLVALG
jgi:hypothetical protein